jgi:MFS family permease
MFSFNKSDYPTWLLGLSVAQAGALLVFMNFAGTLPLIQADMQFNNTQAGTIQGASQFGYVLAVLILSSLTDFVGSRWIIAGGTLWAGLCNLGFALFAQDFYSAIVFRMLTGLGIAGIYMPGMRLISQRIPSARRGRAVGFFVASFTLGTSASIALSGTLAASLGWRFALALTSIGPLIGTLVVWRTLITPSSFLLSSHPLIEKGQRETQRPIFELLHNRPALLAIVSYTAHAWEVLGLRSWLPAFLAAALGISGFGLSEATRAGAVVAGFATLMGAGATALVAALSDRFSRTIIIMTVMGASLLTVLAQGFTLLLPWGLIVSVSLAAAFLTNADSAVISTTLTETVPDKQLGRVLAVYSFSGFSAGTIAPVVFGFVLDYANNGGMPTFGTWLSPWTWAFATLAFGSLVGLLAIVPLHRLLQSRASISQYLSCEH